MAGTLPRIAFAGNPNYDPRMEQTSPQPRIAALAAACRAHGFALSGQTLHGLDIYLELLLKWNKAMNLVGHAEREEILADLILDSFHLAAFIKSLPLPSGPQPFASRSFVPQPFEADGPESWDFGAGAGLPGVPLRLVWPAGRYWLVEAREKRALFLQNVLAACPLPGTRVWRGRAENFMRAGAGEGRRPADLLISRAFLPWPQLLELARGKLAPGGLVVCLTLEEPPAELPADLAAHWRLLRAQRYSPSRQRPEQTRQFWAFAQTRQS